MTNNKTYESLIKLKTFKERYEYLRLSGTVSNETFGNDRYLNQILYTTPEWRRTRNNIITRDNGKDMGLDGYEIYGKITIHHINPVTKEQLLNKDPIVYDPNNLITLSDKTHRMIHYGDLEGCEHDIVIRTANDTCPWRKQRRE